MALGMKLLDVIFNIVENTLTEDFLVGSSNTIRKNLEFCPLSSVRLSVRDSLSQKLLMNFWFKLEFSPRPSVLM